MTSLYSGVSIVGWGITFLQRINKRPKNALPASNSNIIKALVWRLKIENHWRRSLNVKWCFFSLHVVVIARCRAKQSSSYISEESIRDLKQGRHDGSENVGKKKWICVFSNLIASIWTRSLCQMQATFPGVEFLRILFWFKKRKNKSSSHVHVLYKTAN